MLLNVTVLQRKKTWKEKKKLFLDGAQISENKEKNVFSDVTDNSNSEGHFFPLNYQRKSEI